MLLDTSHARLSLAQSCRLPVQTLRCYLYGTPSPRACQRAYFIFLQKRHTGVAARYRYTCIVLRYWMYLLPEDSNDLLYFFNEFPSDSGLSSCFGSTLHNAENVFVPVTAETDGPIPKLRAGAVSPFVDPYDDSLLEKIGSAARIRAILVEMQRQGHNGWVLVLSRLYGPIPKEIVPLRAILGDLAHIVDLTALGSLQEVKTMLSEPWNDSPEISSELMDHCLLTLKVQSGLLRRRAEECFNEIALDHPKPGR